MKDGVINTLCFVFTEYFGSRTLDEELVQVCSFFFLKLQYIYRFLFKHTRLQDQNPVDWMAAVTGREGKWFEGQLGSQARSSWPHSPGLCFCLVPTTSTFWLSPYFWGTSWFFLFYFWPGERVCTCGHEQQSSTGEASWPFSGRVSQSRHTLLWSPLSGVFVLMCSG